MAHQMKVASCCYCGRRTVLQPTARQGHELACASCGAPLHEMKALKSATVSKPKPEPQGMPQAPKGGKKAKKAKKRKPVWKKALGEVFDIVEDIFD